MRERRSARPIVGVKDPAEIFAKIGGLLKAARVAAGKSQKEWAARLNVDQRSVSNYEKGHLPRTAGRILAVTKRAGLDEVEVRRLLFEAWDIEEKSERRQLTHEERVLLDVFANDAEARGLIRAVIAAHGGRRKQR